ncbi:MAG: aminotransferase class V-fold PLP-dependent enzyme [Rhodothermales bacterium]
MTIDEIRDRFPHVLRTTYLNHAATAPLSTPVVAAIRRYVEERHETNVENFGAFQDVVGAARQRIARLIGTTVDRVEFAPNTSYALNVLARGLDWRRGDRVAVPGCEFPANVYPFLNLGHLGVEVDFIPHDRGVITMKDIERALRPATRLLAISWVQYLSGYRMDLQEVGELCRRKGVLFCVDAIQGLGALQLDVEKAGIDFLACGGHKWLMATQGIGFLYVTKGLQERIRPAAGWLHGPVDWDRLDDYELRFHPDASRYRLGTMNHIGVAALEASLGLYEAAGPAWCERSVLERAAELADGLSDIGLIRYGSPEAEHASGIVSVEHERVEELYAYLSARDVEVAVRQQKLRFSPTYYNSTDEVSRALECVASFLKEK